MSREPRVKEVFSYNLWRLSEATREERRDPWMPAHAR